MNERTMNISVLANTAEITLGVNKLVMLMEAAISNIDINAYRDFDRETNILITYEMITHHASQYLSRVNAVETIQQLLDNYFTKFSRFFKDYGFINTYGAVFATLVSKVVSILTLAQQRIENVGGGHIDVVYNYMGSFDRANFIVSADYETDENIQTFNY